MDSRFGVRHSRWRAWIRIRTPDVLYYRLGLQVPKAQDCGRHEWYNSDDVVERCYHCLAKRTGRNQVVGV